MMTQNLVLRAREEDGTPIASINAIQTIIANTGLQQLVSEMSTANGPD